MLCPGGRKSLAYGIAITLLAPSRRPRAASVRARKEAGKPLRIRAVPDFNLERTSSVNSNADEVSCDTNGNVLI